MAGRSMPLRWVASADASGYPTGAPSDAPYVGVASLGARLAAVKSNGTNNRLDFFCTVFALGPDVRGHPAARKYGKIQGQGRGATAAESSDRDGSNGDGAGFVHVLEDETSVRTCTKISKAARSREPK